MKRLVRSEVIEELSWHFDRPGEVYSIMTEAERRHVVTKGFLTKDLHAQISARMLTEPAAGG